MVEPIGPKQKQLMSNELIAEAIRGLAAQLPFDSPSVAALQEALLKEAEKHYMPERAQEIKDLAMDVESIAVKLVRYADELPKSGSFSFIESPQELIKDFVWWLTQPLASAERQVVALEGSIHRKLESHQALGLKSTNFSTPEQRERAVQILERYIILTEELAEEVANVHRLVRVLGLLFADPTKITDKLRVTLHDLKTTLTRQGGSAQGIILELDDELKRLEWFRCLHTAFDESVDPFHLMRQSYPELSIRAPGKWPQLDRKKTKTLKTIFTHLVDNARKAGADQVVFQLIPRKGTFVTVTVMDNGPGIPLEMQALIGKQRITDAGDAQAGDGLDLVYNTLVPQLGEGADVSFISPFHEERGTLFKVTFSTDPSTDRDDTRGRPTTISPLGKRPKSGPLPAATAPKVTADSGAHEVTAPAAVPSLPAPDNPNVAGALSMTHAPTAVVLDFPVQPNFIPKKL